MRVLAVGGGDNDFHVTTNLARYRSRKVIVASGYYDVPNLLNVPGESLDKVIHYYKEPQPYVGKRICIVGIGNSAVDIACDVCVNSETTVIVARSGVMILPKMIFGIPFTNIMMKLYRP